jgi:hypothetical protein
MYQSRPISRAIVAFLQRPAVCAFSSDLMRRPEKNESTADGNCAVRILSYVCRDTCRRRSDERLFPQIAIEELV